MYKKILVPVSMKHSGDRTHKALAHAMGICDGEIVLLHRRQIGRARLSINKLQTIC